MMVYKIAMAIVAIILFAEYLSLWYRQKALMEKLANLSFEVVKLNKKIDAVDQSTGADVYKLRQEFDKFRTDYGEAAVEEMRENAKREKAWADGINSIMSYGARFQGRGDST